jgi:hypothetical protein
VAVCDVAFQCLPAGTVEGHDKPRTEYLISRSNLELGASSLI